MQSGMHGYCHIAFWISCYVANREIYSWRVGTAIPSLTSATRTHVVIPSEIDHQSPSEKEKQTMEILILYCGEFRKRTNYFHIFYN